MCDDDSDIFPSSLMDFFTFYKQELKYTRFLSDDLCDFIWFQMFRNALDDIPITAHAKALMINACRQHYHDNDRMLKDIDEFEKTYTASKAIYWYTRPSFVYHAINTALRTNSMKAMYSFRWYLIDLCHSLRQTWEQQRSQFASPLRVYRGTTMTRVMFDKLQSYGVGALISENGFLSTSQDRAASEMFAASGALSLDSDLVSVLFRIVVTDPQNPHGPIFVNVASFAANEQEDEILFDMSTLFQIMNILYDASQQTWNVELIAVPKNEVDLDIRKNFYLSDREQIEIYSTIQQKMIEWGLFLMTDGTKSMFDKLVSADFVKNHDESTFRLMTSFFGNTIGTVIRSREEIATAVTVTTRIQKGVKNNFIPRQTICQRFIRHLSVACCSILQSIFPLTCVQLQKHPN